MLTCLDGLELGRVQSLLQTKAQIIGQAKAVHSMNMKQGTNLHAKHAEYSGRS